MPALPPAPFILRLDLKWAYGGDTSLTTRVFLRYTGTAPSSTALTTWAGQISAAAGANFAAMLDVNASWQGVLVTDLSSNTSGTGLDNTPHTGTRTGNPLPAQSCMLQNLQIVRRYRGGKPRRYWPFGVSGDLANPQGWTTTFINAGHSAIDGFFTSIFATPPTGTAIAAHVNVGYYHGFTSVTNPVTGRTKDVPNLLTAPHIDDVIGYKINPLVASQRRRISA